METFTASYLIINIFSAYLMYKAFEIFFKPKYSSKVIIIAYIGYYIINSVIFLTVRDTNVNIISNIIMFLLLGFLYKGELLYRELFSILIFICFFAVETMVYGIFTMLDGTTFELSSNLITIGTNFISRLVVYFLIIILSFKFKSEYLYISSISEKILVISMSIVILLLAYVLPHYSNKITFFIVSSISLCIITVLLFSLIEIRAKATKERIDTEIFKTQTASYANELKRVTEIYDKISEIRHSIKNELDVVFDLMNKDEYDRAKKYLEGTYNLVNSDSQVLTTENVYLNSLLNYKISVANENDIDMIVSVKLDQRINIKPNDLVAVIGNLLDNAVEACINCENHKYIDLNIGLTKSIFYIKITNPFSHEIVVKNGVFTTTKNNKEKHGYGMNHVKRIVEKYNGTINIDYKNNFEVEIFLYNPI